MSASSNTVFRLLQAEEKHRPACVALVLSVLASGDTYVYSPDLNIVEAECPCPVAKFGLSIFGTVSNALRHRDSGYTDVHIMHRFL
jgi:hypothetical protein